MRLRRKPKNVPKFTGNCYVRSHTGDGHYVGRCYHSTYDGRCHLHGDVSEWLGEVPSISSTDYINIDWPRDYEL